MQNNIQFEHFYLWMTVIHSQNQVQALGFSALALAFFSSQFWLKSFTNELFCIFKIEHTSTKFFQISLSVYVFGWLPNFSVLYLFCTGNKEKTAALPLQTTALGRALPRWITRCVKASSQALFAQRLCAAPQWDGHGVTPVRCAQPSLTPAEEGSYRTTAPGRAKVKSVPQRLCLFFCFCLFFLSLSLSLPSPSLTKLLLLSSLPVLTPYLSAFTPLPLSSPHIYPSSPLQRISSNWVKLGWVAVPPTCVWNARRRPLWRDCQSQ